MARVFIGNTATKITPLAYPWQILAGGSSLLFGALLLTLVESRNAKTAAIALCSRVVMKFTVLHVDPIYLRDFGIRDSLSVNGDNSLAKFSQMLKQHLNKLRITNY
jgi:hypothetical protein